MRDPIARLRGAGARELAYFLTGVVKMMSTSRPLRSSYRGSEGAL